MPDEKDPKDTDQGGDDDLDARISKLLDAKLNSALTSRDKRLQAAIGKTLEEQIAKLAPAREDKPAEAPKPAEGAAASKADPETIKLREQVEKLTRQVDEAAKARAAVEDKSRRDAARTALKDALAAKGVTGARARAVIADLEASGSVRFDDDGTALLAVKRSRSKGARAEELAFDDLAAGIEDWSKSDDAKEFLPATTAVPAAGPRRVGATNTPARVPAANTPARDLSDDDRAEAAARQLEASGLDVSSIFD